MDKLKKSGEGSQGHISSCRRFSKRLGRRKKCTISAVATVCTGKKLALKLIKDKGKVDLEKSEVVDIIDGTKSFAGQVFNNILFWRGSKENSSLREVQEFQENYKEQPLELNGVQEVQLPRNILKYLQPASTHEIKHVRIIAQLAALSYNFGRLTSEKVGRLVNMELVTTSHLFISSPGGAAQSVLDVIYDGDGMSCSHHQIQSTYLSDPLTQQSIALALAKISQIHDEANSASLSVTKPSEMVSAKVDEAFEVTEAVADGAQSQGAIDPLLTHPVGAAASTAMNFMSNAIVQRFFKSQQSLCDQQSNSSLDEGQIDSQEACAQEWFVCDDLETQTRYFVVQGSVSFASWVVNLTFDPVEFEDPILGAKIHRGVYEIAEKLYKLMLPLVEDHLAHHPFGKVSFTGHSLGGSVATALMFMFRHRNRIPVCCFSPTYTFGGAAAFCEGAQINGCQSCKSLCQIKQSPMFEINQSMPLTERFGFSQDMVRNVVMTQDIVPRAFACDYSLVQNFMKSWGQSFREHGCLQGSMRCSLYTFVGQIMVLQPPEDLTWVAGDGYHAMFPNSADLYNMTQPSLASQASMFSKREDKEFGLEVESLQEAIMQFMDNPHPLDILSDPGAYGNDGRISRYHNPNHYTRGVAAVQKKRTKQQFFKALSKDNENSVLKLLPIDKFNEVLHSQPIPLPSTQEAVQHGLT